MPDRAALAPCPVVPDPGLPGPARWRQEHPTWLYQGVLAGVLVDGVKACPIVVHDLGAIPLTDGRLVACDPCIADDRTAAFVQVVPAGIHRVAVAVTTVAPDHDRILAALLLFGDRPVVRWSLGRTPGDTDDALAVGEFVGYGVDAGTGCFAGPSALPALVAAMQADEGMLADLVSVALEDSPFEAAVTAPAAGAEAVAAFRSGWGDGVYPTWFGHAADGGVVLAMTDFMVIGDPWEPDPDALPPVVVVPAGPGADSDGGGGRTVAADEPPAVLIRPGFWARLLRRA